MSRKYFKKVMAKLERSRKRQDMPFNLAFNGLENMQKGKVMDFKCKTYLMPRLRSRHDF